MLINAALHQASFVNLYNALSHCLIGNPNSHSPHLKGVLPWEGDDDEAWHKEGLHGAATPRPCDTVAIAMLRLPSSLQSGRRS